MTSPTVNAPGDLSVVRLSCPGGEAWQYVELLSALDLTWAEVSDPEYRITVFTVYFADDTERDEGQRRILAAWQMFEHPGGEPAPTLLPATIHESEWVETWKQYFHCFRASKRLVIKPTWETYAPVAGDIVLELDPGMCFGTGYHGTTQACLQFLDQLEAELGSVSVLDAGCGSGILSLAAALLGLQPVHAFDNDPQAVDVTRENLEKIGVTGVKLQCAGLEEYCPNRTFRIVIANILAPVLAENAERLISFVDTSQAPGYLILSGILTEQYAAIKDRFEALGVREVDTRVLAEWKSGLFRRES